MQQYVGVRRPVQVLLVPCRCSSHRAGVTQTVSVLLVPPFRCYSNCVIVQVSLGLCRCYSDSVAILAQAILAQATFWGSSDSFSAFNMAGLRA